ncbi:MAG: AAA family ATPase [Candidatus Nanopelagicaceae bacterium]
MIVFEKIRWKNFLSTGNVFTEVNLTSHKTNLIIGTNGAGKSTVLDALTFSLFGRPFRKINKPMLVNSINEKNCEVEVEFSIGKNEYIIKRGIKPNLFEIYQNGQMLDQSSTAVDYQKQLEQNILKMNYKSFTQIVVLGSSTFVPFMKLPVASRREIIEDILDIQIFSVMNTLLKDKVRENNDELKELEYQLKLSTDKIELQKNYMLELEKKTKSEIEKKEAIVMMLKNDKSSALKNVAEQTILLADYNEQLKTLADNKKKLKQLNNFRAKIQQKIANCKKETEFFINNHVCPTCTQDISQEFRDQKVADGDTELLTLEKGFTELESEIEKEEQRETEFMVLSEQIVEINSLITQLNYEVSSLDQQIKERQDEIEDLNAPTSSKKAEYEKLTSYVDEKKTIKERFISSKKDKDTLSVASQLLKDNGIKSRIIKRYLPAMNKLIGEYLRKMDFYVNFTLDENFEETIKSRYRDIFTYESFSEGEKARIDLALLLTWRSIAKLKNSVDTNLLILDEIFDGSLDASGTSELGWILRKFDDNTNVFVISHKENLDGKFDRTIKFEKVKNFSVANLSLAETE